MGAFFSNIQLYSNTNSEESFRDSVISCIRSLILKDGYIEISEDEKADRIVAISQIANEPWISIYDEALEMQDIKIIDKMSSELSGELKTKSIGIIVCDSDFLRVTAFQDGKFMDEFSNMKKRKKHVHSANDFLKDIIVEGFTFEGFLNAFLEKHVFVEEALEKIAEIINLNYKQCAVGFNYLRDVKLEGLTYLRFQEKKRKTKFDKKADATELSLVQYDSYIDKKVGEEGQTTLLYRNQGVSSKGLQIIIKGPAIESDVLLPISIQLFIKNKFEECDREDGKFWTATNKNNEKLFVAEFPEFKIPEGSILPYAGEAKSIKEMNEIFEKQFESALGIRIQIRNIAKSRSEYSVFVLPISNVKGQVYCTIKVDITK